ncbi:MAG: hypothetical protein E7088_03550 [Bacteroidales bacterium]|nr:hypothetical protein [Bacteroidales bacterium]
MGNLSMVLSGLNGAMGLYSGIKGMLDSSSAARRARRLRDRAYAEEEGWYKRNYYDNLFNNTAARAAIKRVENTLRRQNAQNRASSAITGATPEYSLARNEQGLRSMENVMTNIASMESDRRNRVDAMHRQNRASLMNADINDLSFDERMSASAAAGGFNLMQNALMGVNWGREDRN